MKFKKNYNRFVNRYSDVYVRILVGQNKGLAKGGRDKLRGERGKNTSIDFSFDRLLKKEKGVTWLVKI